MLRCIHSRHEVHYVTFRDRANPAAEAQANEYCSFAYPVPHEVPEHDSLAFTGQLVGAVFSSLPLAISRYRSAAMAQQIETLLNQYAFDSLVCDFLFPTPNIERLEQAVLFQHNVESAIWRRHVEHAGNMARKAYFALQAKRMWRYEAATCRRAGFVVAVSAMDEERMRQEYEVERISHVDTGVNISYFTPPHMYEPVADLIFVGSMDWLANIDATTWFVADVLPLIRRRVPDCTLAIVGRKPNARVRALQTADARIRVTGTVDDVRPYLWGSKVAITPLRVGGGTRLKIYEAIAASLPVVSTTVGAEGLPLQSGEHIVIGDTPEAFANACVRLLSDERARQDVAARAREHVAAHGSWDAAAKSFERILETGPRPC